MSNRTITFLLGGSLLINIILVAVLAISLIRRPDQEVANVQPVVAPTESSATDTPIAITNVPVVEPTATPQPLPTDAFTVTPMETAVSSPTATPLPPTDTPLATDTPAPTPTSTPLPIPQAPWLAYINQFRQIANLPTLTENLDFTAGSAWHSSYMVLNDAPIAHSEDPSNNFFEEVGDEAARNGNIFATTQTEARFNWAINFWFSAPFHALPLLDPRLESIGYGDFVGGTGTFKMAAVTDVRSGISPLSSVEIYPVFFPGDGGQTWITRLSLHEWPDPYGNCPGYQQPTGPAILVQLGSGDLTPHVTTIAFTTGDEVLPTCTFNETNYTNPNAYAQDAGRSILGARDAVVIIPRDQLVVGQTYTVTIVVNEATHTWSFDVIRPPQLN